jgi:integrase
MSEPPSLALTTVDARAELAIAGQVANAYASQSVFSDYLARKSANTRRRQRADLARFADYLAEVGITTGDLAADPGAWSGVTWGLVEGFRRWMVGQGDAIGSINVRLSTVRTYARMAGKAGAIGADERALIGDVGGYSLSDGRHIDDARTVTRRGRKKAEPVRIDPLPIRRNGKGCWGDSELVKGLKRNQPDTPQGRRDALLMCLLLDHGLRCGEVAGLQVTALDLVGGTFSFFRPKVHRRQTHRMTTDTLRAARAYLRADAPAMGPLLRGRVKGGALGRPGMSVQNITARVRTLGARAGISGLSAHDCRHYWATLAARNGTPMDRLMDAGGWASPAMPMRYIDAAAIANDGVLLDPGPGDDAEIAGGIITRTYQLPTAEGARRWVRRLRDRGFTARQDGRRVVVEITDDASYPAARRLADLVELAQRAAAILVREG